ncbi:GIY-YIG nuclease superfamily [uncultured Caudovirales phage]|uniref:GIY-YIG nuclease superfamily n=1 Tax=uncultured Caudovirales phage TaxID=2100421 RepID=A0A6J5KWW5_9CAUD|nr:GIY-YIG nuclease superfamily [uncultured Caudovirales phage]
MFIYKTTNLINGKYYIGKYAGKRSTYLGSGIHLKSAVEKYGRKNFKRIVIEECTSLKELSDREKYWIELFDAVNDPRSYNLTEGGQGGFSHITKAHYADNLDKKYGKTIKQPPNAITSECLQEYVVTIDGVSRILTGMDSVSKYLGIERSQVYKYFDLEKPKKGYKHESLSVDTYTKSFYSIDGIIYQTSKEVCDKHKVSGKTLHYRCLKSERMDWWKIVEVKEKWKKL